MNFVDQPGPNDCWEFFYISIDDEIFSAVYLSNSVQILIWMNASGVSYMIECQNKISLNYVCVHYLSHNAANCCDSFGMGIDCVQMIHLPDCIKVSLCH